MELEEHMAECKKKLGKPYEEVHRWLDRHARLADGTFDPNHRHHLHNQQGIDYVTDTWGELAGEAARLHIISDLKMEGFKEGDKIPRDAREYRARFATVVSIQDLKDLDRLGFVKVVGK